WLILADKVYFSRDRRTDREFVQRQYVCLRCIVDKSRVDLLWLVTDQAQAPGTRLPEHAGYQVLIARTPDEMRTQGHSRDLRAVRSEHALLGEGLGLRVRTAEVPGVRRRFIDAVQVAAV